MKVFISADIEGVTTTNNRDECNPAHAAYPPHAKQMTQEVRAACEGALAAGATEIVVKDAHGPATNIDPTQLQKEVTLIRGWSFCPELMVEGIDASFDAALFVGYHSAAGRGGNPLAHTIMGKNVAAITINGRLASEFMIYSLAAAYYGVPAVFLSGDKTLCEDYADLHPSLVTVAVKDGIGGATYNRSTEVTVPEIRAKSEQALRQDLSAAKIELPEYFEAEIRFKDQAQAEKAAHFPDVRKLSDHAIAFGRADYREVLRTLVWTTF